MYSTRKIVRRQKYGFCLFQNICKLPRLNYLDQLFLPIISYHILLKLRISVNLKFQKTKTDAPTCDKFIFEKVYLFKHASQLLPSILPVLLQYLHHFCAVIFSGVCFEMFTFICWFCCCFLFLLSFSFLAKLLSLAVKTQPLQQPLLN